MIITREFEGIAAFDAWSGAIDTKEAIINADKATEFDALLDDIFPNGCTETELNDYLWFNDSEIYEMLGMDNGDNYDYDDDCDYDDGYIPSSTYGDYSPSAPWNAPGMSISDFI